DYFCSSYATGSTYIF
nr:immunoglobulin light chain junction region [Macaca mulatta]